MHLVRLLRRVSVTYGCSSTVSKDAEHGGRASSRPPRNYLTDDASRVHSPGGLGDHVLEEHLELIRHPGRGSFPSHRLRRVVYVVPEMQLGRLHHLSGVEPAQITHGVQQAGAGKQVQGAMGIGESSSPHLVKFSDRAERTSTPSRTTPCLPRETKLAL